MRPKTPQFADNAYQVVATYFATDQHAQAYRIIRKLGPRDVLEAECLAAGCPADQVNLLLGLLAMSEPARIDHPYFAMDEALGESISLDIDPLRLAIPMQEPERTVVRWPTGLSYVDQACGGYGITVVAGKPKVGKSLVAIGAACESVQQGWRVAYVNAELTPAELDERLLRYTSRFNDSQVEAVLDRLHLLHVSPGVTVDRVIEEARVLLEMDDTKLLLILDSINRLVKYSTRPGDDGHYWAELQKWSGFLTKARRDSEGLVSGLIVSELNARGAVKGLDLEYEADQVISINRGGDDPTKSHGLVEIAVPLNRSGPELEPRSHLRMWQTGHFIELSCSADSDEDETDGWPRRGAWVQGGVQ